MERTYSYYKKKITLAFILCVTNTLLWAQAVTPFSCSNLAFQIIASGSTSTLYSYDLNTGTRTQIGNTIPFIVNGIGYSPVDNMLYGSIPGSGGQGRIIKIDANAQYTTINVPNLSTAVFNQGDVTPDGYLLLPDDDSYYYVDVNPNRSGSYGKLVNPTSSTYPYPVITSAPFNRAYVITGTSVQSISAADFSYNASDGLFYAIHNVLGSGNAFRIITINPKTRAVNLLSPAVSGGGIQATTNGFGAAFFDASGSFYVFANSLGRFYKIDIPARTASTVGAAFAPASSNDGAACPFALLVNVTLSGNVFNDTNGLSDGIVNGAGVNPGGLYAVLWDIAAGEVLDTAVVSANGGYILAATANTNYNVIITTTPTAIGTSSQPISVLPQGWLNSGENLGAGLGSDGNPNGVLQVSVGTADVANVNFGIQHLEINPDFNSGYTNQAIAGSIATNDKVLAGSSYGTPVVPSGVTNPGSAVPAMNADGSYSFTAATPGVYTFDVPVCTGAPAVCVMNRLTITVADPAIQTNPPVANPDLAATSGTTPVTIKTLANDQPGSNSPALNPGSVSILTAPKNGTATRNATTGDITYTPNTGFVGQDTLYYQVCNTATPTPQCSPSYQVITVDPAGTNNTSATDDYNVTTINTAVSGNVKTNDIDAQGNTTTVTAKTETITGKGTISIAADGSYTFTPANGYTGPVNFTYTICDNGTPSVCANASLYLLVQPNSTLPVVFGSITAYFKDGMLYVNWNTQTEKSCKEYAIEGSIDGVNWKTVGTVLSKARDGNSDTPLNYEFSTGMAAAAFAGMGLALLLLMPGIRNKKIKWLMILAATFTIVACSKKMADEVATGDTPTYIRILQKDIDGTVSYSKIIKVKQH